MKKLLTVGFSAISLKKSLRETLMLAMIIMMTGIGINGAFGAEDDEEDLHPFHVLPIHVHALQRPAVHNVQEIARWKKKLAVGLGIASAILIGIGSTEYHASDSCSQSKGHDCSADKLSWMGMGCMLSAGVCIGGKIWATYTDPENWPLGRGGPFRPTVANGVRLAGTILGALVSGITILSAARLDGEEILGTTLGGIGTATAIAIVQLL